jgi:hypothetical protein
MTRPAAFPFYHVKTGETKPALTFYPQRDRFTCDEFPVFKTKEKYHGRSECVQRVDREM